MKNRLSILFFILFGMELILPSFRFELIFDLSILFILSTHLIQLIQRRSISKRLHWTRIGLFVASGIYAFFLLKNFWDHRTQIFEPPGQSWRSLMHAWFFLSAMIVALSSAPFIRFFANSQQNPPRFISLIYTLTALIFSLLLVLPVSLQENIELSYLDAFFTSVSALSGAGLVVKNIALSFSLFGQILLLILIQAGGIGIITFSSILLFIMGKELGLHERVMQDDLERLWFFGSIKKFVISVSLVVFAIEFVGALLILPFMLSISDSFLEACFHAVFHSISAFCTAGFSSLPNGMLIADGHPFILIVIGILGIIGMLGMPTIFGILYLLNPKSPIRRLGAYQKMEGLMAIGLMLFGTLSLFFIEAGSTIYYSSFDRLIDSFFQSSQRGGGFNSVIIADMSIPALFILMSLMFVAGAPMSTAGGIKTSTIGTILIFVISFIRGKSEASFAKRRLPPILLTKAVTLLCLYLFSLFIGYMILIHTESATGFELLFEAVSALSLTGFSLGITENLTSFGKATIILLMMLGRIGITTVIYALIQARKPDRFRYPQGDFYVG